MSQAVIAFSPQFNLPYIDNKVLKMGPQKWAVDFNFTLFFQLGSNAHLYKISKSTDHTFKIFITSTICFFFQGPKPKVLEEKMVDLGQELPDIGPGVGLQYDVSCTPQGTQNALKEAARKIAVLSQEKQQLIEMGNRLRAELGMVLKEGKLILQQGASLYV